MADRLMSMPFTPSPIVDVEEACLDMCGMLGWWEAYCGPGMYDGA